MYRAYLQAWRVAILRRGAQPGAAVVESTSDLRDVASLLIATALSVVVLVSGSAAASATCSPPKYPGSGYFLAQGHRRELLDRQEGHAGPLPVPRQAWCDRPLRLEGARLQVHGEAPLDRTSLTPRSPASGPEVVYSYQQDT
jgi:hypothetical protein